jgi:hypothetical protein
MQKKRIKDFNSFVNESYHNDIDEGIFSTIKKYGKIVVDWSYQLLKNIIDGLVAPIPYGPKKGLPTIMLFIPGPEGTLYEQMLKYQKGVNPISNRSPIVRESEENSKFDLKFSGSSNGSDSMGDYGNEKPTQRTFSVEDEDEDIKSSDSKNSIIESYDKKSRGINSKNVFIQSSSDKSKIESVASAGDELSLPVLYMELKYIKSSDLFKDSDVNISNILPPDNGKKDRGGIIFLESLDQAEKNISDYFVKLSREGFSEGYRLPSKWIIVASGKNPDILGDLSGFNVKNK